MTQPDPMEPFLGIGRSDLENGALPDTPPAPPWSQEPGADGGAGPARDDLVQRTRALAGRLEEAQDRDRMLNLAGALAGGASAATWRAVSPQDAFDIDALAAQLTSEQAPPPWLGWLEIARNALIFVPVLVTWWAISGAADTYRHLLAEQPERAPLPFLYLWETSFDGRLGGLTLSQLATVDSIVIAVLVVLTVAPSVLHERAQRNWDERFSQERRQLTALLSDAALALAARLPLGTADTMQRLDEVARALLTDLRQDRTHLREVALQQTRQSADLREATLQIKSVSGDLGVAVRALAEVTPKIDGYLHTIEQAQSDLAATHEGLRGRLETAKPAQVDPFQLTTNGLW